MLHRNKLPLVALVSSALVIVPVLASALVLGAFEVVHDTPSHPTTSSSLYDCTGKTWVPDVAARPDGTGKFLGCVTTVDDRTYARDVVFKAPDAKPASVSGVLAGVEAN